LVKFPAIWYTYYMAIWYILWSFWYVFPVLVYCTKDNLAAMHANRFNRFFAEFCKFRVVKAERKDELMKKSPKMWPNPYFY
jgi:hypothetical protein